MSSRRMPRDIMIFWIAVLLALVAITAFVVWYGRGQDLTAQTVDRVSSTNDHGQIVEVRQAPVPEGPPGPIFKRDVGQNSVFLSLKLIEPYIPNPLPDPLDQNRCTMGGSVFVRFEDRSEVEYGPCRTPVSIERLRGEMMHIQRSS